MTNEVGGDLAAALGSILGGDVVGLHQLSGGASRETWAFELWEPSGAARPLILRREPASAPDSVLARERWAMEAAGSQGVRVPAILVLDDGIVLGRPGMVMERVAGEAMPHRILRALEGDERDALLVDCADQLARIHAVPVDEVPDLRSVEVLEHWRGRLREHTSERPVLELVLRWLERHRPEPADPVLVHGDFRMGNLVTQRSRVTAVLDWELTHLGDAYEDLGWFCTKAWRFGEVGAAGGLGSREQLAVAYGRAAGTTVDLGRLRWWEVMNGFKWAVMCLEQYHLHASGAQRSLELASLGWRTCEAEWDLINLLAEPQPSSAEPPSVPIDRSEWCDPSAEPPSEPGVLDVLGAVVDSVRSELIPEASGRAEFTLRMAARLLDASIRLQGTSTARSRRRDEALASLGVNTLAQLADRIRDDRWEWDQSVVEVLRELTRDRLSALNPRYLAQPFPPSFVALRNGIPDEG